MGSRLIELTKNAGILIFFEFSHARERCSHRCERLKNPLLASPLYRTFLYPN